MCAKYSSLIQDVDWESLSSYALAAVAAGYIRDER